MWTEIRAPSASPVPNSDIHSLHWIPPTLVWKWAKYLQILGALLSAKIYWMWQIPKLAWVKAGQGSFRQYRLHLSSTHESHFGQIAECSDKCCASGSVPYFALPRTGGSFKHQPVLASHTRSCCSILVRLAYSLQLPAALHLPESSLSVLPRMFFYTNTRDATSLISMGQAPIPWSRLHLAHKELKKTNSALYGRSTQPQHISYSCSRNCRNMQKHAETM